MSDWGLTIDTDPRTTLFEKSMQRTQTGNFINFSLAANGDFGINISGSLAAIPQLAQVSAIIQGILGIFGLQQTAGEPLQQYKEITTGPGVTLATLFGASQGVAFLVQVLKNKINAIKNYVTAAVTSITNLFQCILKNPLLAATILAKIVRQGWIKLPEPVRLALTKIKDVINETIGLNILINNPLTKWLASLKEWLMYKFPPEILLPFIPYIPGCTPEFYSGRPPVELLNAPKIVGVEPRVITIPGGFTSKINIDVPVINIPIGPNANPDLALTDDQVQALLGSYDPYNLSTAGILPNTFNADLISNYPTLTPSNSATRQVQDKLITASNKVVNDITVLNKDISRAGYIPRPSPLDDLLCAPGEKYGIA
jgi:hypothetical protein